MSVIDMLETLISENPYHQWTARQNLVVLLKILIIQQNIEVFTRYYMTLKC